VVLACHEDPNTGLPRAGVRLAWRTYEKCPRPIETYVMAHAPSRSYRLLSRVSVTCTYYVPDECDDALRARACDLGGDAVLVEGLDESSTPLNGSSPLFAARAIHPPLPAPDRPA
jgi:hypothetical protein